MKILMTLMKLDIGGAETHVVELSKSLKRRGHEIFVASGGGVYVRELEEAGIVHVTLPLDRKTPQAILKNYFGLKKLINREKFDIVHAHARIPAFICGLLAQKSGFKFITTAHYDFKLTPLYKKCSDWGEYQLAVSQDLKNYLVQSYGENPDNISVTINGIDTDKFKRGRNASGIMKEFVLDPNKRRILYVGRIDREVARAAILLAENAYRIANEYPDTEIIIVGGGDAFDELSKLAAESNRVAGRRAVILAGARTDIADFIAVSDIFVGVSRAALEAMASEKPTVLAGAQGYMGIFEQSMLETAKLNNFTCRGEAPANGDILIEDISKLLGTPKSELEAIGSYNRSVVLEYYSVSKMTDDYLHVYENCGALLCEPGEVIISGYYGYGNLGDDTLLRSLISSLRHEKRDIRITVLCANTKKMRKLYGVRTINRYDLPAIVREMRSKNARILLNGGGSLIQDGTSERSMLYYVSIMKLAKRLGLKLVLYANGIGPLYSEKSKARAKQIIDSADMITLREPSSLELIRELGCSAAADRARISADPAFCTLNSDPEWVRFVLKREGIDPNRKFFMVSVRPGNTLSATDRADYDSRLIDELAAAISVVHQKTGMIPIFVPFQSTVDAEMTSKLRSKAGCGMILSGLCATELTGVLAKCEFAISMRLHLLIFAASVSVPVIGLSYDRKVDAFLSYIGEPFIADIRSFTAAELESMTDEILKSSENIKRSLAEKSARLRKLSEQDAALLVSMLRQTDNR